tara:strand:+ start:3964 stop:4158 length:195 start_codon:yes stop_codon:yes gene_type:complete
MKSMENKKYSVGVDITYGIYIEVEAESLQAGISRAKLIASRLGDSDRPKGTWFVGVTTHSETEV